MIMVSLTVVALSSFVEPSQRENLSFQMMKEISLTDSLREKAAQVLRSFKKASKVYKGKGFFKGVKLAMKVGKFRESMLEFKSMKKARESISSERDVLDVIIFENDYLRNDLETVAVNQIDILEGANKLLDKVSAMKSFENDGDLSLNVKKMESIGDSKRKRKRKRRKKKNTDDDGKTPRRKRRRKKSPRKGGEGSQRKTRRKKKEKLEETHKNDSQVESVKKNRKRKLRKKNRSKNNMRNVRNKDGNLKLNGSKKSISRRTKRAKEKDRVDRSYSENKPSRFARPNDNG